MIFLILLLGFLLRVVNLDQSYWLDEAISLMAVKNFSFNGLIFEFPKFDFHPPLYYLTLKLWTEIFGYSEIATRLLSVILGISTVLVVYFIAKKVETKKTKGFLSSWPHLASLFLATSALHVYYSQEVRMYAATTLVVSVSVLLYILILKKGRCIYWVLFSASLVILMGLDYVPIFFLPLFWIVAILMRKNRRFLIKLGLSFAPLVLVFSIWLPIFLVQVKAGSSLAATFRAWSKVIGGATAKQLGLVWVKFVLGRITFIDKVKYAVLISVYSLPFLAALAISFFKRRKIHLIFWTWFIMPLALGFIFSLILPTFSYFRYLFVLPAFYLLLAHGCANSGKFGKVLTVLILTVNLVSYYFYVSNRDFWREDWRGVVRFVEEKAREDELVLFEFTEPVEGYKWYSTGKVEAKGALPSNSPDKEGVERKVSIFAERRSGVWYFVYLRDLTDPNNYLLETLGSAGFKEEDSYSFTGIGSVIHFVKQ